MRLILSYPSWASALHTYHYLALIYRVWSSLVTWSQFLHVITASSIITHSQTSASAHSSHSAHLSVWTTIGTLLSIESPAGVL